MGCGASTQAATAVASTHVSDKMVRDDPGKSVAEATSATVAASVSTASKKGSDESLNRNAPVTPNGFPLETRRVSSVQSRESIRSHERLMRAEEWKVRPGYSSGASSYEGETSSEDEYEEKAQGAITEGKKEGNGVPEISSHSDMLSMLRQEMAADGDLIQTVVRIETPFGKPIEEIYNGVHDGPVLGSGVSGVVRLVVHKATGVKYAVKCLDIGLIASTEGLRQLRDEIFIMCQLDHPNIVRIEEVYESASEIYIVQELCLGGDLFDRLDQQPDYHYTEVQCARLVKQMLSSIRYLHGKGIIHRDLKLENFLFSSSKPESELKMIDFGLSKHFEIGQHLSDQVGTPYTVAPEIIRGDYDEKCDMWALGVITYLLLSGETPFGGLDGESLLLVKANIMRAKVVFHPQDVWENVSDEGKCFVKTLLNPDPKRRPTAKAMQRDPWIQVWAKKDAKQEDKLSAKTVSALITFKESSDMQKLLSEVLSFTLLPEQIEELREEFEKVDTEGSGEISLTAMKEVLLENAEAGALGALTEQEIEDIFNSIRMRKTEPTIRWHEFLAAGLSQARVDDRNLRLAFDRLDTQRKGYLTFDDLSVVVGASTEYDALEKIWLDSLEECKAHLDRITFSDFKKLMKGQPKDRLSTGTAIASVGSVGGTPLNPVPEGKTPDKSSIPPELIDNTQSCDPRLLFREMRSLSYTNKETTGSWYGEDKQTDASRAVLLSSPSGPDEQLHQQMSPLVANRVLYRKNREMRLAVLDASKQFDKKRNERIQTNSYPSRASLIMKRGAVPPIELEDAHTRALFEAAARRCGRTRRMRNKTKSDVTGMLIKAST